MSCRYQHPEKVQAAERMLWDAMNQEKESRREHMRSLANGALRNIEEAMKTCPDCSGAATMTAEGAAGQWLHVSPHQLPVGTKLIAGGASSNFAPGNSKSDFVYLSKGMRQANNWAVVIGAGKHPVVYLYEVEPKGSPRKQDAGFYGQSEWVVDEAVVTRAVGQLDPNEWPLRLRPIAMRREAVNLGIRVEDLKRTHTRGVKGTVSRSNGPVLAWRGFGSWDEARTALRAGSWRSDGSFVVRSHEGETQAAGTARDVLRASQGRQYQFVGMVAFDVRGLEFHSLSGPWNGKNRSADSDWGSRSWEIDKANPTSGLFYPDIGAGIGFDAPIPIDRVRMVCEITNGKPGKTWTLSEFAKVVDALTDGDKMPPERQSFDGWGTWRLWTYRQGQGQVHVNRYQTDRAFCGATRLGTKDYDRTPIVWLVDGYAMRDGKKTKVKVCPKCLSIIGWNPLGVDDAFRREKQYEDEQRQRREKEEREWERRRGRWSARTASVPTWTETFTEPFLRHRINATDLTVGGIHYSYGTNAKETVGEVVAYDSEGMVGDLLWVLDRDLGEAVIDSVFVEERARRKGIATKMLEVARANWPGSIYHSNVLSSDGRAWSEKVGSSETITFQFHTGYEHDGDTYAAITATDGGEQVGSLTWIVPGPGEDTEISYIWVKPTHRRQGLATRMLAEARKAVTYRIGLSDDFTDMGRAWSKTVAASKTTYYHGSSADLPDGTILSSDHHRRGGVKGVYFTTDIGRAMDFSVDHGPVGHVYEVEPIGDVQPWRFNEFSYRAPQARIIREVSLPKTASVPARLFHGTPHALPIGTILVPGGPDGTLEVGGHQGRHKFVWMADTVAGAKGWGEHYTWNDDGKTTTRHPGHIYEVEPIGECWQPPAFPKGDYDGPIGSSGCWVAPQARIIAEVGPRGGRIKPTAARPHPDAIIEKDGYLTYAFSMADTGLSGVVEVYDGSLLVGTLLFMDREGNGTAIVEGVEVHSAYRRQGIASRMLEVARSLVDYPIVHSTMLTGDGEAWSEKVGAKRGPNGMVITTHSYPWGEVIYEAWHPDHASVDTPEGEIGYLALMHHEDGYYTIDQIIVNSQWRRRGVASALLARARRDLGDVRHSRDLTPDGRAWSRAVASKAGAREPISIERDGNGYRYKVWGPDSRQRAHVEADDGQGNQIGLLTLRSRPWGGEGYQIHWVGVEPEYRRRGVARFMLEFARQHLGTIVHSDDLTSDGRAWSQRVGAATSLTYDEFDRIVAWVKKEYVYALDECEGDDLEAVEMVRDTANGGYADVALPGRLSLADVNALMENRYPQGWTVTE